jgi:hypothetical protein
MTNQHPITPPNELAQQWYRDAEHQLAPYYVFVARCAARWGADQQLKLDAEQIAQAYQAGADQELEACVKWVRTTNFIGLEGHETLRAARRPKPPILKEQALTALHAVATGANDTREQHQDLDTIRQALEQLNDE